MTFANIEEYLIKSGIISEEEIKKLKVEFNLLREEKSFADFLYERGIIEEDQLKSIRDSKLICPEKIKVRMIKQGKVKKIDQKPEPEISENLVDTHTIFVELFDRYDIIEVVGRGAMSWIYKVKDLKSGRIGALKILKYAEFLDSSQVKRFERETEVVKGLKHPNIVRLYEFGSALGVPYYVMDYIEGNTFEDYISTHDLTIEEKIIIMEKIARAIHYAHVQGVIHRDLKPSNIIIKNDGEPLLVDFGIAKMVGIEASTLTAVGEVIGTPAYMAPEQALGRFTDQRGDIFSIGAILYECLTNFNPFIGDTIIVTLSNIVSKDPAPPSNFNPKISPMLEKVILKCLEKVPENRYATAEELADDLEKCRRERFTFTGSLWIMMSRLMENLRKKYSRLIIAMLILLCMGIIAFPARFTAITILRNMAADSMDAKNYNKALCIFNLLAVISFNEGSIILERGICKRHLKQYEKALEDFDKIKKDDKANYHLALMNKGYVYLVLGKYDIAISILESSLKGDVPKDFTYLLIAKAYQREGNYSQALFMVEKSLKLNPDYKEAQNLKEQLRKSPSKPYSR